VSRLHWRVQKIENRSGDSRAVAAIVDRISHASKRELYEMIHDGLLGRMAKRLSGDQLDLVIERCKKMLIGEKLGGHTKTALPRCTNIIARRRTIAVGGTISTAFYNDFYRIVTIIYWPPIPRAFGAR
jgi:hypothetical protein